MSRRCSHCGNRIVADEWHPVATRRNGDGRIQIYDFCCEACRSAWVDDGDDRS